MNCLSKHFRSLSVLIIPIFWSGCAQAPPPGPTTPVTPVFLSPTGLIAEVQQFMDVGGLGKGMMESEEFSTFLTKIPKDFNNDRLFLARVDEFAIGSPYSALNQWDLALENGLVQGLLSSGYKITEKLDFVAPRDASEYVGTSPKDAFYMHGIDLNDHNVITKDYKSPLLLEYQVMEFEENQKSAVIYFRMVDLASMKILASTIVKGGEFYEQLDQVDIKEYDRTYDAISNYNFPSGLYQKLAKAAVLNIDILNITGAYKSSPSKNIMAVENGLVSGLIDNSSYRSSNTFMVEKSSGFKFKYPTVYNNIVFNTNPVLYEEWSELIEATGCSELIMYRYLEDEGIYIRVVDASNNGMILFSDVIPFSDTDNTGVFSNYDVVSRQFNENFDFNLLNGKKLLLVDGDKQPVAAETYSQNRNRFNEMHLAIEEGIVSALVSASQKNNFSVYEKLKTLYLKRSWMYNDKIFNLNPLYLDNWQQMKDFGVDIMILYNNLIPYEDFTSSNIEYKKTAITYRVIDFETGDVVFVGEISNMDDADADGVLDNADAFPEDPSEWEDSDGDGVGDNADAFPEDPSEWEEIEEIEEIEADPTSEFETSEL